VGVAIRTVLGLGTLLTTDARSTHASNRTMAVVALWADSGRRLRKRSCTTSANGKSLLNSDPDSRNRGSDSTSGSSGLFSLGSNRTSTEAAR